MWLKEEAFGLIETIYEKSPRISRRLYEIILPHRATGISIFPTTGMNQSEFISYISISWNIHRRKIMSIKIPCTATLRIQSTLARSWLIVRNTIAKMRSIFPTPGKKLDFTGCRKSFFTSAKCIITLAR